LRRHRKRGKRETTRGRWRGRRVVHAEDKEEEEMM